MPLNLYFYRNYQNMKKLCFIVAAAAAALLASCSSGDVKYTVKGSAPEDGTQVYLVDMVTSEPIDSAIVSGGAFLLKGKAAKDAFLNLTAEGDDWTFMLFNDGVPVQVDFADNSLEGSDLNKLLSDCDHRNTDAYAEYNKVIEDFEALPEEEQEAKIAEFMPKYQAAYQKYSDFYMGMIEENKDNLVPVAFIDMVPSLAGKEKFEELLASGAPFASHPYVLDIKRKMDESEARRKEAEEKKQAIIGQQFLDLEEADPDGNLHKLSEYVGQGRWALVDFWASWCGPCKAEMPNVVAAYKKYHDKGFDIVGLSFDREKEPWVKAITEWEMPWIHLSDLKYWKSVASDVYTVNSIPDNLLIDPEGKVVARGLRGSALEAKLAEVIK